MTAADAALLASFEIDFAADHAAWALRQGFDVQDVALALCHEAGLNVARMPRTVEDDLALARLAGVIAYEQCRADQRANPRRHKR